MGHLNPQENSSNFLPDDLLLPFRAKAEARSEALRCKRETVVQYEPPCWLTSTPPGRDMRECSRPPCTGVNRTESMWMWRR
jgi:hypothetical protein